MQLAFPQRQYIPTLRAKFLLIHHIPAPVPLQFGKPVSDSRFRNVGIYAARVLMPETAANFDDFPETREHQIGLSGEVRYMKPIPKTHVMNKMPNNQLG